VLERLLFVLRKKKLSDGKDGSSDLLYPEGTRGVVGDEGLRAKSRKNGVHKLKNVYRINAERGYSRG